jgi:hypothetical protein
METMAQPSIFPPEALLAFVLGTGGSRANSRHVEFALFKHATCMLAFWHVFCV